MNIEYLNEFIYLAESLSFKRTAEHFYASRSVISRHMASLEETVGMRLLDRGSGRAGQSVMLTEAGRVFYHDAKAVLHDWNTALERVREFQDSAGCLVRIGYLRNAARPVLIRFVRHMETEHPEIKLALTCMEYNELHRALDEHAVDIALAVNVHPTISRNYRSTFIYKDRFMAVCSKNHPLANRTDGITIDDLRDKKLLLPDSYIYGGLSDIIDDLVDEKSQLVAQSYYRDIDMLYLKVQTEGYVAFSSNMNNTMFGNRVAVLPVEGIDTEFSVSAFYHDSTIGNAFAACSEGFEWCRDELASQIVSSDFTLRFFD